MPSASLMNSAPAKAGTPVPPAENANPADTVGGEGPAAAKTKTSETAKKSRYRASASGDKGEGNRGRRRSSKHQAAAAQTEGIYTLSKEEECKILRQHLQHAQSQLHIRKLMIDKLAELYESVNIMIREFEPSLQSQDRMINNLERQAEIKDKYIQLLMDREAENDKEINRLRGLVGELSGGMLSGFPDVETSA